MINNDLNYNGIKINNQLDTKFIYNQDSKEIKKIVQKLYDDILENQSIINDNIKDELKVKCFEYFRSKGNEHINKQEYRNAIIFYKEAIHHFHNDLTSLNNLGLAHIKLDLYGEGKQFIVRALEISSDVPQILNNYSLILKYEGKLEECEKILKETISKNPNYLSAKNNLGLLYIDNKEYSKALLIFNEILKIDPMFFDAYQSISKILNKIKDYKKAIQVSEKAVSKFPDLSFPYNSMGISYYKLGDFVSSIKSLKHAVNLNQNNEKAYNNLGNTYLKLGEIDLALESFFNALKIKFPFKNASSSLLNLLIQQEEITNLKYINILLAIELKAIFEKNSLDLIYLSISAFVRGEFEKSKTLLKILNQCDINEEDENINSRFILAYRDFLNKIFKDKKIIKQKATLKQQFIYHVGDSHSLSFAYENINFGSKDYTIIPKIIFGAKAFHFSQKIPNHFKSLLKKQISNIPINSRVLLSFGEIDCRHNEGICTYYLNNKKPLIQIIEQTVLGYLNFLEKECRKKNLSLIFMGVHAPILNPNVTKRIRELQLEIIKTWNKTLYKNIFTTKHHFINTFKITSNDMGYSNLKYMVDKTHLKSNFIKKIII